MVFIRIWKPNPYEIFKHKSGLGFGNQTPTKFLIIKSKLGFDLFKYGFYSDLETKPLRNF
jgi:hypothetical protein